MVAKATTMKWRAKLLTLARHAILRKASYLVVSTMRTTLHVFLWSQEATIMSICLRWIIKYRLKVRYSSNVFDNQHKLRNVSALNHFSFYVMQTLPLLLWSCDDANNFLPCLSITPLLFLEPRINLSPFWKLGWFSYQWFASTSAPNARFQTIPFLPHQQHRGPPPYLEYAVFRPFIFRHISAMSFATHSFSATSANTGPPSQNGSIMSYRHKHNTQTQT